MKTIVFEGNIDGLTRFSFSGYGKLQMSLVDNNLKTYTGAILDGKCVGIGTMKTYNGEASGSFKFFDVFGPVIV